MRELFGAFFGNAEAARNNMGAAIPASQPKASPVFVSPSGVITEEVSSYARAQDNLIRAHPYAIPINPQRSAPVSQPHKRKELAAVHKPEYKEKLTLYDVRSFQKRRRGILGKELRRLIAVQELAMKARAIDYSVEDALDVKAFEEDHQISSDSSDSSSVSGEPTMQTRDMRDEDNVTTQAKKGESTNHKSQPIVSASTNPPKSGIEQQSGLGTTDHQERPASFSHKAAGTETNEGDLFKSNAKPFAPQPETTTMIPLTDNAAAGNLAQISDSMMTSSPSPPVAEVTAPAPAPPPLLLPSNVGSIFAPKPETVNAPAADPGPPAPAPLFSGLAQAGLENKPVADHQPASSISLFGSSGGAQADPVTATSKPDVPPSGTGLFGSTLFGGGDSSKTNQLSTGLLNPITSTAKPAAETPSVPTTMGGGLFSSNISKPESTSAAPMSLFGSSSKPAGASLFGNIGGEGSTGGGTSVLTQTSQPSVFQPPPPVEQASTSLFGSTSAPLFGGVPSTAPIPTPITTSLFGTTPIPAAAPTTSLFSNSQPNSQPGSASSLVPATSSSLFGQGSLFGANNMGAAPSAPNTDLFGNSASTIPPSGSIFGTPDTGGLFGNSQAAAPEPSLFAPSGPIYRCKRKKA